MILILILGIKAKLRGSEFPATELFLKDSEGLLFVAVGFYEGSVWSLRNAEEKHIMNSHIKYKDKDAKGAYRNVELGDKTYSRETWNKMIEHLDPSWENLQTRLKEEKFRKKKQKLQEN